MSSVFRITVRSPCVFSGFSKKSVSLSGKNADVTPRKHKENFY